MTNKAKPEPVLYDDLAQRIENARALADALYNQDPDVEVGQRTLFGVSGLLLKEIDAIHEMWKQHWDTERRA